MDPYNVEFLAIDLTLYVVNSVTVAASVARYIVQGRKPEGFRVDDWIHVAALILSIITVMLNVAGRWVLDSVFIAAAYDEDQTNAYKIGHQDSRLDVAGGHFYWLTNFTAKSVFLFMYKRLFWVSRPFRIAWWCTTALMTGFFVIGIISNWTGCGPTLNCSAALTQEEYDRWVRVTNGLSILSIVGTDVLLICLPIGMLVKLQTPFKRKLRALCIFCLGLVTIVIDIFSWSFELGRQPLPRAAAGFIAVEPSVAVLVAALPSIMFASKASRQASSAAQAARPYKNNDEQMRQVPRMPSGRTPLYPEEHDLETNVDNAFEDETTQRY